MAAEDAAAALTELLGKEAVGGSFADFLAALGISGEGAASGDAGGLMGMLGAGGDSRRKQGQEPPPPGMDPKMLELIAKAMAIMNAPDPNIELLRALRPYLAPARRQKADEAIKVMRVLRLVPLLKESGLFGGPE